MEHSFDIDVAVEYGVNPAILLKNIFYWCEHNKANNKHFYEGEFWTFNSGKAFHELFPYLSEKQIRSALKKLEDEGLVICGNFNKSAYDRTMWYAVTQKGKSILQKGKMEDDKRENGITEKVEPIPYINTDKKETDVKQIVNGSGGKPTTRTQEPKTKYGEYKHVQLTDKEVDRLFNDYGEQKVHEAIKLLDEYIEEKGYKSKNHNLAIRRWVMSAVDERQQKNKRVSNGYDWDNL